MRYVYSLWQNGIRVAQVDAPTKEDAEREIQHYAMQYSEDGEIKIRRRTRKTTEG